MSHAYYFAYGDGTDPHALQSHCPVLRGGTAAHLRGFKLARSTSRRGGDAVTTVVRGDGAVTGRLYRLPSQELETLDATVGKAYLQLRTLRSVRDETGRRHRAWVYVRPLEGPLAVV